MDNTIKKRATEAQNHSNEFIAYRDSVLETASQLVADLKKFGFDTVDQCLAQELDGSLGQAAACTFLELQERCRNFLQQKEELDKTVYIEPSKLPEAVESIEQILIKNRSDHIYQRSGKLVHVTKLPSQLRTKRNKIRRATEAIVIRDIDQAFLTVHLTKIGIFLRNDDRSGSVKRVDCPERLARYLLAKHEWDMPLLTGVISAPTLRVDGSILDVPGYDPASGLLFISEDRELGHLISDRPTLADAKEATEKLMYLLKDFPFDGDVSKAVVLAAILTALIRRSITTAPLFGFTAPKMRSGKSLLADMVSLIATGKANTVVAQAESEAEEKKRLMALLIEGDPIVCYDNIDRPFGSAALCAILTQLEYKDRVLGETGTRSAPTNVTFLATGNNLIFDGDISTRTLLCRIDPQIERPEEREFDLDIPKYISEHRSMLVCAGLTILRAYHAAGRPKQNIKPFGGFEEWSNWIRSALIWIGLADPCESRKAIEKSDLTRVVLTNLLSSWHTIFGNAGMKLKDVLENVNLNIHKETHELLNDALFELAGTSKGSINLRTLAKKLAPFRDRIESGLRLEQIGSSQGTTLWRVKKVS